VAVSPGMGLGVRRNPLHQGMLEEGPFPRWWKRVGVRSKTGQVCPLPVSVADVDRTQASSESVPELQITLLPLLVHIITVN